MIVGLYTAAGGMVAVEERQAAIANNIANASTTGFKAQSPVQLGFYEVFSDTLRRPSQFNMRSAPAGGVKNVESYPDLSPGALWDTGDSLNVALQGPGFIALDTAQGVRYTRSGEFTIATDGSLVTPTGNKVQNVSGGSIDVRGGAVSIDQEGHVTVDHVPAGQIRVVEFDNPKRLLREGDNIYVASSAVQEKSAAAANTTLAQGSLELSNVNLPHEMTMMLLGMRAYEANSKVMQTMDSTLNSLISQVGMPSA